MIGGGTYQIHNASSRPSLRQYHSTRSLGAVTPNNGGIAPKWARGGKEILYNAFDGKLMSVEIDTSRGLRAGTPKPLFQLPEGAGFGWDVTADGERFLVNVPVINSSSVPLNVVMNWTEGLKN